MYKCSTKTEYHRSVMEWTIDKLSIPTTADSYLRSTKFSTILNKGKNIWDLTLLNHHLFLGWYVQGNSPVTVQYTFYISKPDGEKKILQEMVEHTFNPKESDKSQIFGKQFNVRDELNTFKKNTIASFDNDITLCCEVIEIGTTTTTSVILKQCKKSVLDDYKNLWETKDATDVTLVVGDEEFKAHKAILVARCPVFRAMFTNDNLENNGNNVTITDIDANVIKAMLEYIYTDTVEKLDEVAFNLLAAADKYQLDHLKNLCEESLTKSIDAANVMQLLVWADRHHSEKLVQDLIEFFKKVDGKKLMNTTEFKDILSKSYPHLSLQICQSLITDKALQDDNNGDRAENTEPVVLPQYVPQFIRFKPRSE